MLRSSYRLEPVPLRKCQQGVVNCIPYSIYRRWNIVMLPAEYSIAQCSARCRGRFHTCPIGMIPNDVQYRSCNDAGVGTVGNLVQ